MNISIFTPTHDTQRLNDAYQSIKDQDFHEWIIVYNGGAEPVEFHDDRVKHYTYNIDDWSIGKLKGFACERATGDILLELDHDDLLMPWALDEVRKAFEDESVGFVYSNTVRCTDTFEPVPPFAEGNGWEYRYCLFNDSILDEYVQFEPTPSSVSLIWYAPDHIRAFRKTVYDAVGGYNKSMRVLDDLDLMCRMYVHTKFRHIDLPLYVYRVHGENTCAVPAICDEIQQNVYRIHEQYFEDMALKWASDQGLRKIELGASLNHHPAYESVDIDGDSDITADLTQRWPFGDNSVGVVRAYDVFEHLPNSIHTMNELHRVLAPGGYAIIQVPSTDGRGAFQDPTHCSFWNENSFKYYTDKSYQKYISKQCSVRFQPIMLYTTQPNNEHVCWVKAHLTKLGSNRVPGNVRI